MISLKFEEKNLKNSPAKFVEIDKIFSDDVYKELLGSFSFEEMEREDKHKKIALNKYHKKTLEKFLDENKLWKNFLRFFESDDFVSFVNYFCNLNSYKNVDFKIEDLNIGYEFSILKNNSVVVPHKDKYGKLLSLVFYFVSDKWEEKYSYGGTQFYKPKKNILNSFIFNDSSSFENVELVSEIKPKADRLLVFQPNKESWHGVEKINTEDKIGRPAFILTVHRKETLFEKILNFISPLTSRIQKIIS